MRSPLCAVDELRSIQNVEGGVLSSSVTRLCDNREIGRENTGKEKRNRLPLQKSREHDFISRKRSSQHHWFHRTIINKANKQTNTNLGSTMQQDPLQFRTRASKDEKARIPQVRHDGLCMKSEPTISGPDPNLALSTLPPLESVFTF